MLITSNVTPAVRDIKARGYRTPARAMAVARRYRRRFPSAVLLLTQNHEFAVAPWLFELWRVTFAASR